MTWRHGHGNGAGKPRIEVLPADELPRGVPTDADPPNPDDFDDDGKFAPGNTIARRGGQAKAGRTRLAHQLGLTRLNEDAAMRPYRGAADAFRRAQCSELAATVGGGVCGPGPSAIVASAALQLGMSRYLSDLASQTGDPRLMSQASKLANDSRLNLMAAHELAAREAVARQGDDLADLRRAQAAFQAGLVGAQDDDDASDDADDLDDERGPQTGAEGPQR